MPPLTIKTYTCSEYEAKVACSMLASPPPPANYTALAGAPAAGRRSLLHRLLARAAAPSMTNAFVPGTASAASWGNMWSASDAAAAQAAAAQAADVSAAVPSAHAASPPLAAPPPPPPPQQQQQQQQQQQAVATSGSATSSDAAAAPTAAAGWNQWSGAGSAPTASPQCSAYFRQITFLSSLTIVGSLSGTNSSWVIEQPARCGATYVTATLPVSKAVYMEDMFAPSASNASAAFVPMRWCQLWPQHFEAPAAQPVVTVRGAGDPYLVAAATTRCTLTFATSAPHGGAGGDAAARGAASLSATGILANRAEDALLVAFVALCLAACAVGALNQTRPKAASYATLLRESPRAAGGPPGSPLSAGYGGTAVGLAGGAAARGGDVEVTAWLRAAKGDAAALDAHL
jgi:hypothetical protein